MVPHIELISRGILQIEGHFLLCVNRKGGYAYLPGGHVEFGESATEALEREFLEETGLRTRTGKLLAVSEASFKQKKKARHEVNLVFHVELATRNRSSPLPVIESLENDIEFRWASQAELRRLDVRPSSAKAMLLKRSISGSPVRFDSDFSLA